MRRLFHREEPVLEGLDVGALAPMVDMMTLLLVFLLRSYSTESAPHPPEGPFALAGTLSEQGRKGGVEILISSSSIYIDGVRVGDTVMPSGDLMLPAVYERLLVCREKVRLEIHADQDVSYGVIKRVLYTARSAGFLELSLVGVGAGM